VGPRTGVGSRAGVGARDGVGKRIGVVLSPRAGAAVGVGSRVGAVIRPGVALRLRVLAAGVVDCLDDGNTGEGVRSNLRDGIRGGEVAVVEGGETFDRRRLGPGAGLGS
jgi:hypothetical protein